MHEPFNNVLKEADHHLVIDIASGRDLIGLKVLLHNLLKGRREGKGRVRGCVYSDSLVRNVPRVAK